MNVEQFQDQCMWALSCSPILSGSALAAGASLLLFFLTRSKSWLFIAACAAPYGIAAVMALR